MEKEYYHDTDKNSKKNKIITGARKTVACVALTGAMVGGIALRLASLECAANHSIDTMCPLAKLETYLFGIEAGMQHQVNDIEKYSCVYRDRKVKTEDVNYVVGGTYILPEGFELRSDEDGQVYGYREVPVVTTVYINEFGEEQNAYSLEVGGVLAQDKDGRMYGYQIVEPKYVENDTIYFKVVTETGEEVLSQDEMWIYYNGEYSHVNGEVKTLGKTR